MKFKFFVIPIVALMASCSDAVIPEPDDAANAPSQLSRSEDSSFSFDEVTRPEIWASFNSLEEMKAACQIPEPLLSELSTQQLVEICMDYPLLINYTAYDDPFVGISHVVEGFNGFAELFSRNDAAEALLSYYENIDVSEIADNTRNPRAAELQLHTSFDLGALEMIMSYGYVKDLYSDRNIDRLENAANAVKAQKEACGSTFGSETAAMSEMLRTNIMYHKGELSQKDQEILSHYLSPSLKKASRSSMDPDPYGVSGQQGFLVTNGGKPVAVLYRGNCEMSPSEICALTHTYVTNYPQARYISISTNTYNGHSYAWNMSDGGPTCWIVGGFQNPNDNIKAYWTDGYYYQTPKLKWAQKVSYYESNHSSIISQADSVISKWGNGPLMCHKRGYGPYEDMNLQRYYSCDPIPYYEWNISNPTLTGNVGSSIPYYATFTISNPNFTGQLTIFDAGTNSEATSNKVQVTKTAKTYITAKFLVGGIYYVGIQIYDKNGVEYESLIYDTQILIYP